MVGSLYDTCAARKRSIHQWEVLGPQQAEKKGFLANKFFSFH